MGLLDADINSPEGQGLLQAAFSLMGAQRLPGQRGLGSALGEAGRQYLGTSNQARDSQMRRLLAQSQLDENNAQTLQRTAAMEALKRKREALPGLYVGAATGGGGIIGTPPVEGGQSQMRIDYLKALQAGYTPDEIQKLAELPNAGRAEVARTVEVMENGRPVTKQLDKFGQPVGNGFDQWKAPLMQDLGGRVSAIDPVTLQERGGFGKTMTFADRNAARNLALSRQRLAFDQGGGVDGGGASQAAMIKQFGKPSAGYRWKADGSQEFIPGGPADQKAQLQKSGEGTVGSVVADLRDKYNILNEQGGIVSTQKNPLANLSARLGSTGVGQALSGAVGTKTQSARESIAMTRPLLLQSIMKATGMSAKQMDSNAELKLYLATATDPTLGLEANMAALDRIEALYGGGSGGTGAEGSWTPNAKSSAITKGGWSATLKK